MRQRNLVAIVVLMNAATALAQSMGTAFTYQGQLKASGVPASGLYDMQFTLFDSATGGSWVAPTWCADNVAVTGGVFTVSLDFGTTAFDGNARWLEISVRADTTPNNCNDPTGYALLSPRQTITPTPAAISVPWGGLTGVPPNLVNVAYNSPSAWFQVGYDPAINFANSTTLGIVQHPGDSVGLSIRSNTQTTPYPSIQFCDTTGGNCAYISMVPGDGLTLNVPTGVGINTDTPDQLLTVNGNASKSGGGSWATFSDARLKHDIRPLHGALDQLLALRGVTFEYNDPAAIHELPGRRIGMVAQEVEKVFPDWVDTGASGYKSLTFRGFEALTVESLRDLRAEKDAQIAELTARIQKLEALLKTQASVAAK